MTTAKAAKRGGQTAKTPRERAAPKRRSAAEWVSLGLSLVIVAGIVGLVVYAHLTRSDAPPVVAIQPRLDQVRAANGSFYLPVEVTNEGGQTVEALNIDLTLSGEGEGQAVQVTLPFLADGETARAVVVFGSHPADGTLAVTFSYLEP